MKRADRLYEVRIENNRGESITSGNMWVIATSLNNAKSKAVKWARDHRYRKTSVTKIEAHGTIDVF